jgi:arylsulfatase A-like enzyme
VKRAAWLLAASGLASGCHRAQPAAPLRNLVLIVVDTLRQDHLRAYGYERETAPALTRLAAEGVRADGVSPSSWTKPAVASLLTGLHPLRHQAVGHADALPSAAVTLAERLGARGYSSLGVTANGWLSRDAGFAQGFDAYDSMLQDLGHGQFSTAQELNAELLPRLASLRPPYFLYVHYLDPHAPYDPDRAWNGLPLTGRLARRRGGVGIQELNMQAFLRRPAELLRDARDLYDGEIRRADDAIEELLAELRRLRLSAGTLSVVTSDHGEELEEHGRMGHGQALYEESVRVPLVFHAPGMLPAGGRVGVTSLLDVLPTCLELLGIAGRAEDVDGVSVASALRGAPAPGPAQGFSPETAPRELLLHLDFGEGGQSLALRGERLKLLLAKGPYRKELFDRDADAREQRNLLDSNEGRALFEPLAARLAEVHNQLSAGALPGDGARERSETTEAMAALGYVGAAGGGTPWRRIPARIRPAELRPGGALGWEDPQHLPACLEPGRPEVSDQLLQGWGEAEGEGRWLAGEATALVRNPGSPSGEVRLRVRGRNGSPRPARVRLHQADDVVADVELPPGPFDRGAVLTGSAAGPMLARFEAGSAARDRSGGLLVRRLCLEP